jgi:uncharacterized damage-inducible protein DinB
VSSKPEDERTTRIVLKRGARSLKSAADSRLTEQQSGGCLGNAFLLGDQREDDQEIQIDVMQHLANHSTYHRGQVALMMRQLQAEPLATDFHVFLVEGRREAAPAN